MLRSPMDDDDAQFVSKYQNLEEVEGKVRLAVLRLCRRLFTVAMVVELSVERWDACPLGPDGLALAATLQVLYAAAPLTSLPTAHCCCCPLPPLPQVAEVAQDQNGCRFLQKKFDEGGPAAISMVFQVCACAALATR